MKKRLIDANALIAEYDRVHIGPPGGARKLMEDAPTVDAVEVVRCKDCESRCKRFKSDDMVLCGIYGRIHSVNWFCADGERRTDENV